MKNMITNLSPKKMSIRLLAFLCVLMLNSTAQTIIGWDASSSSGYGVSPWPPASINSNLSMSGTGVIRGSSILTTNTAAGGAWGGSGGWSSTADAGCVYFTFSANSGYKVSLTNLICILRRSAGGPPSGTLEYALNGGAYVTAGNWATSSTTSAGTSNTITLSGVTALQNVASGTSIKLRFTYSSTSGNWYFTGAGSLVLNGAVVASAPAFSASIAQTASISCNGDAGASLTASVTAGTNPPYTYSWMPSGGTASVASGLAAGVYSCVFTSATSQTTMATYTVTQPSAMNPVITAKNITCNGLTNGSATVAVTGGSSPYTYTWSAGSVNATTVNALAAGVYTVDITDSKSCVASKTVSITEPASLTATLAQSNATCNGGANGSATVTPAGGTSPFTNVWSPSGGNALTANNLAAGDYTVLVSDSKSCTTSQTLSITQPTALGSISGTASSSVVCSGSTISLSGSGASTYTWSNGVADGAAFTPTATGTYTVLGTEVNGCNSLGVVSVTVNATPTITVNSGVICPGGVFVLTPGGAATYTFSSGSATVTPTMSTTYSVDGTSAEGCPALAAAVSSVDVSGSLSVSISGPTVICNGDAANLTANGASTYTWSTGALTYTIAPAPTGNTTYSVIGASGSCSNTAVITVSVNSLPTVTITGNNTVCAASTITLTAGGASTYTWSTGAASASITPSPTANIAYTVTGTDANGCPNAAVKTITVNPTPTVVVPSGTICSGSTFTFNPSGGITYTFSGGVSVSPTTTTSYSVTGINAFGCTPPTPVVVTVAVYALPTITVNSGTICAGKIFTITPSGANTYTYSGTTNTVNPTANTSYSVTGTSTAGCVSATAAVANVTVNASPTITVNSGTICAGKVFTMTPSGANTYTYSSVTNTVNPATTTNYSVTGTSTAGCVSTAPAVAGVTVNAIPVLTVTSGSICAGSVFTIVPTGAQTYTYSGNSNTVSPATTISYSVAGTSSAGCVSSGSVVATVTVISLPVITVNSGSVCAGSVFTMSPAGASTYTFSSGTNTVSPAANTSYSVTGTSTAGCVSSNTAVSNVTVVALPVTTITSNTAVCNGSTLSLVASGATTYTWSTASNNATITVSPTVNTTYTLTGTANGCSNAATVAITVNPIPTINISSGSMCPGAQFTLMPTGAASYTYSGGSQTVSPATTTSYSVTGTSSLGCVSASAAVAVITVTNSIVVSIAGPTLVCANAPAVLTASGAQTYTWSTGVINPTVAPTPTSNTTYSVLGASGTCTSTAVFSVNTLPSPVLAATASGSAICSGQSSTLHATGADTYTWTNGVTNGSAVSPTTTSTYTVSGTDANGCIGESMITVTVNANPVLNLTTSSATICSLNSASLTVTGAATYSWNNGATTSVIVVSPTVTTSYSVTGTDANGCKTASVIPQEVSPCTGIASLTASQHALLIYPNPNTGEFIIRSEINAQFTLVNELGQVIRVIKTGATETQIKGLEPGIYFLGSTEGAVKQKIVVTR